MPPFGRHFQGGPDDGRVPGLKTWAVLFDHFMVKNQASSVRTRTPNFLKKLNRSETPHGSNLYS
jgi:hypothetical protein